MTAADEQQARAVHVVDQSIVGINRKVYGYRNQLVKAIAQDGYDTVVAQLFLVLSARQHPDAVAALAAVAISRLARDVETGP